MGANIHAARAILTGLCIAYLGTAQAELGGTPDPVYNAQTALAAGATQYTRRQADGVTVRQYVNASGRVFGVAWEGPLLPDFQRLLGSHFAAYAEAQRQQLRNIRIQRAELVLDAGGMMRSFSGRAYLPRLLPPNLAAQDIR